MREIDYDADECEFCSYQAETLHEVERMDYVLHKDPDLDKTYKLCEFCYNSVIAGGSANNPRGHVRGDSETAVTRELLSGLNLLFDMLHESGD